MYSQSQKPQVHYTLQTLSEALYRMMERMSISEITVTALCKEAGIARRSYYRNCSSIEDLVAWQTQRRLAETTALVNLENMDAEGIFRVFFEYWLSQKEFLRLTYIHGFAGVFLRELSEYMASYFNHPHLLSKLLDGKEDTEAYRLFYTAFMSGALCNVLLSWSQFDFVPSVDVLIETFVTFAAN